MAHRWEWSRYATAIGVLSCVMIALSFLVPWYGADYVPYYGIESGYRVEYSAGIERMGDLMSEVTIVLSLSLGASIIAAVMSYLSRKVSGVIAGAFSAGLLLTAAAIFYFGAIDELSLESFSGLTHLNRTWDVQTEPMLGWWLAVTVPALQGVQAVVLAHTFDLPNAR